MASRRTHTVYNDVNSPFEEIKKKKKIEEIEETNKIKKIDGIEEIEELKIPYQDAKKGNWTGVVHYYEKKKGAKLDRPMNLDGDNVLHLAGSSCSKSQCKGVLQNLIDLCSDSTTMAKSLRAPNIDGNNALHQVSVSGSVEAAKFLVKKFNDPVVRTDEENNDALELLWTRNHLGETPLYRAATLGHTDLVKFYLETLMLKCKEKYQGMSWEMYRQDCWPQLIRPDGMSVLRMAVVGQHFETAHWLLKFYPFLGQMKDENGLTSLQLLAQMPTASEPHCQQSQWKMLIYHCLRVREDDVESGMDSTHLRQSMDSTHHQDDVESGTDTNHPRQSIFRKKLAVARIKYLAVVMKAYYSLWDSLAKESEVHDGIIYRIWKDKKNKKSLTKLIKLLVNSDHTWLITDNQENKRTISLGPFKDGDDGGEKGTQSNKTIDSDGGDKQKDATKLKKEARKEVYKSTPLLDKIIDSDGGDEQKEANKLKNITGNVPIVQEILEQHPQAVKYVNEEGVAWLLVLANADGGDKQKEATKLKKEARKEVYTSTPLLIASVTGNVHIVKEILEQHPQAVEHVNEKEHNILHLAIKNRQEKIFDLIKSNLTVMSKLSKRIDSNGNTILHQAADRSYYSVSLSNKLIGPAMQLQDELRWFQRVKEIVPPHYIIHHNKKDKTAEELFNDWHDQLLEEAQKWVKETAQSCSTVAVLVATVVFAAAYTIPGGTNDQNGLPLFQNDPLFMLFTSMDVVAIASSLSSVAFFLSVLSSPLEYPLFVSSIPNKVMAGFIFLFISMATTMLAFAATILLLIRVEKKWTKSLLYPIAFFPVPLFGLLQFPMYQSFRVMFHEVNAWFFKPVLYFLSLRRSLWCKNKKHE
ncbi:uncharacterized protein [Malus domestica]|uniref:uncharacterized protein isoform X1 n=1 Tax=Malus domestica TaxID=3750 RepID=UPI0010AA0CDC|nr:uncharacterized protein LOC103453255 isoform X1 [Malus domestica]